jgi:hypothetical protein
VYSSTFFSLPTRKQTGELLSHEEVVNGLQTDTVSYGINLGMLDRFPEMVCVRITVEVGMYEKAVEWMRDLLYGAVFDVEK